MWVCAGVHRCVQLCPEPRDWESQLGGGNVAAQAQILEGVDRVSGSWTLLGQGQGQGQGSRGPEQEQSVTGAKCGVCSPGNQRPAGFGKKGDEVCLVM